MPLADGGISSKANRDSSAWTGVASLERPLTIPAPTKLRRNSLRSKSPCRDGGGGSFKGGVSPWQAWRCSSRREQELAPCERYAASPVVPGPPGPGKIYRRPHRGRPGAGHLATGPPPFQREWPCPVRNVRANHSAKGNYRLQRSREFARCRRITLECESP